MLTCAELFVNYLREKNYQFNVRESDRGDIIVDFPNQGKICRCFFSGDDGKYLSLYIVFENVPADKITDALFVCNELNCAYKWATFYIDGDNDIIIHDDAILSPETAAGETIELMIRLFNITDEAKPKLMKVIYA